MTNTEHFPIEITPQSKLYRCTDVIITLLAVMVMPVYLYGVRVLILLAAALIAGFLAEYLCVKIAKQKFCIKEDRTFIVTSLITVILMPATVSIWVVVVSVLISLFVAKHPFGGTGKNIFNPAAVGVAFSALCWPEQVLNYPIPFTTYRLEDLTQVQIGTSPASVLRVGGTPKIDYFDIMMGKFSGPLGATCMIVLACCLLYLLLRRVVSPGIVFSAFGFIFFSSLFFPRVITGEWASLIFEFSAGAFVFGVIFMANDPATRPLTKGGRVLYGLIIGLMVFLLRRFGSVELEFVYAILIANIFASSCDRAAKKLMIFIKKSRFQKILIRPGQEGEGEKNA